MGSRLWMSFSWLRVTLRQLARLARTRSFDPYQESAFRRYQVAAVHEQARFGIALGFLAWCSFGVWDALAFPAVSTQILAIRLLLVAPLLGWIWWCIAGAPARRAGRYHRYVLLAPVAAAAGLIAMMETASQVDSAFAFHTFGPAFSGLYFFLYTFLGIPFKPAALIGNCLLMVLLALWSTLGLESHSLGPALLQLGILNFIGMIVCARSEIHLRAAFRTRQHYFRQIETAQRERSNAQNARDQMLKQRQRAVEAMRLVEYERGRLAAVTAEKERFFAAAYHDLQQPLSIIGLYSHLARTKLEDSGLPSLAADIGIIERAAYDIGLMFKGVRDTWEIGRSQPTIEPVELAPLLEEIRRELNDRAVQKGLEFRLYRSRRAPLKATSDRTLLKRALSNLVSNAIKYTDRGGVIFGARQLGGRLCLEVWDSGVGIPPEFSAQIFEPYFQVGNSIRDRKRGLGLGLAIVRQIEALLPEHRLHWTSRLDHGSRFVIDLPIATAPGLELVSAVSVRHDYADVLSGKYVLVVDDEPAILRGVVQALRAVGCAAEGTESCTAARLLLDTRDRCPDLLITDYRLEHGATGLDVVGALRERFEWAMDAPILFITAELMPAAAFKDFRGNYEVYPKPLSHAELLGRAARLLSVVKTPADGSADDARRVRERAARDGCAGRVLIGRK